MTEEKNLGGKPPYYSNVEDLKKIIDDYFNTTPENRVTITGLALHLGFTSRQALINYAEKPEFVDTIKTAKLKVEQAYENRLIDRGNGGDIFALKNFDWKDKTEIDTKQSIETKTDDSTSQKLDDILAICKNAK